MGDSTPDVVRYYAYQVTNAAGFYLPVSLLFLQDRGFGLFFVGLSRAVFNFAFLTVEIPGGYVSDRFGHFRGFRIDPVDGTGLRVRSWRGVKNLGREGEAAEETVENEVYARKCDRPRRHRFTARYGNP